jgi:S-adenosylmethionine:tRNA ribosyltransferase-isomerase
LRVDDFDYVLPQELIAQTPVEPRDASRLFVLPLDGSPAQHAIFRDLPGFLQPDDLLVFNDTRVLPARLFGVRSETGAHVEFLLLRPLEEQTWEVLVKPGKKVKPGTSVVFGDFGGRVVRFTVAGDAGGDGGAGGGAGGGASSANASTDTCAGEAGGIGGASAAPKLTLEQAFEKLGRVPLPPYITAELEDPERYQTIYSAATGSAAAPTAGLHFTPQLFDALEQHGIKTSFLTLHVGLGTFRPVSTDNVEEHHMHSEFYSISPETANIINEQKAAGKRVIAVGTTTVRTLETVADNDGHITPGSGWTNIFIYPGYRFKVIDALITNFHLPRSSLLMLVSALAGRERILEAYQTAIAMRYRFFSFGDAMLLI